jgi:tetratricopeptide (TPR) repeat protein
MNLRTLFGLVLVAMVLGIGAGSVLLWRWNERTIAVQTGVPELPDLTGWSPEFDAVLREASAEVGLSPYPLAALGRLGGLYHVNGFGDKADQIWRVLRKLDRPNARWSYLHADALLQAGKDAEAEEALSNVVLLEPSYAPAWLRLGKLRAQRGAAQEARECFVTALRLRPDDPFAQYELLALDLRGRSTPELQAKLQRLREKFPATREIEALAAAGVADPGTSGGSAVGSRAEFQLPFIDPWVDGLAEDCFDPRRLHALGQRYARERRAGEAAIVLERAVRLAPNQPGLWVSLADIYVELDRVADAAAVLEAGIDSCAENAVLMLKLSRIYAETGRETEARRLVHKARSRWPNHAEVWIAAGKYERDAQKFGEALASFRAAQKLDPASAEAQFNVGWCLLRLGETAEACRELERAVELQPDHADALKAWSEGLRLLGKEAAADEVLARAKHASQVR